MVLIFYIVVFLAQALDSIPDQFMTTLQALEIFVQYGEKPEINDCLQMCLNLPCECMEYCSQHGDLYEKTCTHCDEKGKSPEEWQNKQIKFKVRTLNKHLSSLFTIG